MMVLFKYKPLQHFNLYHDSLVGIATGWNLSIKIKNVPLYVVLLHAVRSGLAQACCGWLRFDTSHKDETLAHKQPATDRN
jgi:hypothetical protein